MDQENANEFDDLICQYVEKRGLDENETLSLLSAAFVGAMALKGLTGKQFDIFTLQMKKDLLNHPNTKKQ